ncbi:MAG TPA: hypothetical protein VEQ18_04865 [Candidatus Nitrosocosmicus sp.]|nr:hypothetical protein [Candidatus Nitrosocosmicus sp.]
MNNCISSDDLPERKPRKAAPSITIADTLLKGNKIIAISAIKKVLSVAKYSSKNKMGIRIIAARLLESNSMSEQEYDMITILGTGTLIIDLPNELNKQCALLAISLRLLKMGENNKYPLDPKNMSN